MRRIVMFNRVSADGYFASEDGALDWVVPEDAIDRSAVEGMPDSDTILFGRRTYDMFESFWPSAYQDASSAPDPHVPGRKPVAMEAMARWIHEADKIVFSGTRTRLAWHNSRVIRQFDPVAVAALKERPGKNMMIFGSGTIVSLLTEHGLIDEYQFVVTPLLLGSGKTPIAGISRRAKLELVEAKSHPSGNVMLRYLRSA